MADLTFPRDTDLSFGMQIADDNIIGTNDFFVFGRNPDINTGAVRYLTPNDGVHVPLDAPTKIYLVADDPGDVGKPIRIEGLDANYEQKLVTIPIEASAVDIGDWAAIHRMFVLGQDAVIGNVYASTITNPIVGGVDVQSLITPEDQNSFNLYYMVGRNKKVYAYEFIFTDYRTSIFSTSNNVEFYLETRTRDINSGQFLTPWIRRAYSGLQVGGSSGFAFTLEVPYALPEGTEARIGALSSVNNFSAAVGVQLIVRDA